MGNVLDLLPPQRGQRGDNLVNLYSTPIEQTSTALVENELFGEEWVAPRVGLKWLNSKKDIYYVWRDDFTCLIQDLNVFGRLPVLQDIHRVNVIIPCMAHVYRVLGALINLQKSYLYKEHHLSQPPSTSQFQFVVADEHLWTYQHTWQSYQNALRITYGKSPDNINTEQELHQQQNFVDHEQQVSPEEAFIASLHKHHNRGLNGGGHQDKELTARQHQGFSGHQNIALEDFNLGTLQEVLKKHEGMLHPKPPLQRVPHNIRDKEENDRVNSAETKVSRHLNSRGVVVFPNKPSSRANHRILEEPDPRNIVAPSEHDRDNPMHPSRHETTHDQNHNLVPPLDRQTHLLPNLEELRQSPSQFRDPRILAAWT